MSENDSLVPRPPGKRKNLLVLAKKSGETPTKLFP